MGGPHLGRTVIRAAITGLAVFPLVLGVFLPLVALVALGIGKGPTVAAALAASSTGTAAIHTLLVSFGTVLFTLVVGVPLGAVLGRGPVYAAGIWRVATTLPYVLPPYVLTIAWIALLNPTNGHLNVLIGGWGLPRFDIYGILGMILVMGLSYTPLVALGTADALARVDPSLEEQARLSGAGPLGVLARVTLPLALPAIVEGAALVLATSAAGFGVPYLLGTGSARPTLVLTTRAVQALDLDPQRGPVEAVALCILLMGIGLGLPAGARAWASRRRTTASTGKASRRNPVDPASYRGPTGLLSIAALATYTGLAVILPLGTLILTSLMGNVGLGLGTHNLSTVHYVDLFWSRTDVLPAFLRSLLLAAGSATVAVFVGSMLGYGSVRRSLPAGASLANLARAPYAIPGTVLALGMILAFSQEVRLIVLDRMTITFALADTVWLLGLAYTVKYLAFPVGAAETGLASVDPVLEESARIAGASWTATLTRVVAPLLRPQLVGSWFLVFMPAFSEVTLSILLQGPQTRVIGTLLFELQSYGNPPAAAALGVVLAGTIVASNLLLRAATGGRAGV